jgi:hypothetical protein
VSNRQSRENHHNFLCSPFLPDADTGIHGRIANMHSLLGLHDLVPVEKGQVDAEVMESVLGGSVALAVATVAAMADPRDAMADSSDGLQSVDAEVTDSIVGGVVTLSLAAVAEQGQTKKAMQC